MGIQNATEILQKRGRLAQSDGQTGQTSILADRVTSMASQISSQTVISQMIRFEALPKAELDCYPEGCLCPETILFLASEQNIPLPVSTVHEIAQLIRVPDGCSDLLTYLQCFELPLLVLQTSSSIRRACTQARLSASHEGVSYLELRFGPSLHMRGGLTLPEILSAAIDGICETESKKPIIVRLICCGFRNEPTSVALEVAQACIACKSPYIVGFDLAGPESDFSASRFKEALDLIRQSHFGLTLHAGEGAGAESIQDALKCDVQRIGHAACIGEKPD